MSTKIIPVKDLEAIRDALDSVIMSLDPQKYGEAKRKAIVALDILRTTLDK